MASTLQPERARGREELAEMVRSVGFWWHSIDLGQGVVTPGEKRPETLESELQSLRLPDLAGRTVLDIGAYDGFYSFEAERRGAERVVALDHYVWSLDLPGHIRYWRECRQRGTMPLPNEETPFWHPDTLPGKRGFDTAHAALGSRVESVVGDFTTMSLDPLGTFDVVLFLGVLYHMKDPLGSLTRLASVTRELAVIETHAMAVAGYEHLEMCELYSANQLNGDVSNWWGPNLKALEGMCRAAGFRRVDVLTGPPAPDGWARTVLRRARRTAARAVRRRSASSAGPRPRYFRAVVHAWK